MTDNGSERWGMRDMIEQVKDATTPEEMRAEIFRLRHYDHLARSAMDAADYKGMSAEDRYTILAYYALRERAKLLSTVLDGAMLRPIPPMIVTPNSAEVDQLRTSLARCLREAEGWMYESRGCKPSDTMGYDGWADEARRLLGEG